MNQLNKRLPIALRILCSGGFLVIFFLWSFVNSRQAGNLNGANKPHRDSSGIYFRDVSWDTAIKTAALGNKYIFVDAYASWCGPCKLLKNTTFRDKSVVDFFNLHFVNLSIDMEHSEGKLLAEKWGIKAYPTLIIFDSRGRPVLESIGFLKPQDLLSFAQKALEHSN